MGNINFICTKWFNTQLNGTHLKLDEKKKVKNSKKKYIKLVHQIRSMVDISLILSSNYETFILEDFYHFILKDITSLHLIMRCPIQGRWVQIPNQTRKSGGQILRLLRKIHTFAIFYRFSLDRMRNSKRNLDMGRRSPICYSRCPRLCHNVTGFGSSCLHRRYVQS